MKVFYNFDAALIGLICINIYYTQMQTVLKVESLRLFKHQNPNLTTEPTFISTRGRVLHLFLRAAENMAKSGTWLKCALGTWNCQSKYVKHGSVCPWLLHHFFLSIFPSICSAL